MNEEINKISRFQLLLASYIDGMALIFVGKLFYDFLGLITGLEAAITIAYCFGMALFLLKDVYKGRSLGKWILGLRVVPLSGEGECGIGRLVLRNVFGTIAIFLAFWYGTEKSEEIFVLLAYVVINSIFLAVKPCRKLGDYVVRTKVCSYTESKQWQGCGIAKKNAYAIIVFMFIMIVHLGFCADLFMKKMLYSSRIHFVDVPRDLSCVLIPWVICIFPTIYLCQKFIKSTSLRWMIYVLILLYSIVVYYPHLLFVWH